MREKHQFMTGPSGDADRSCCKTQYLFSSKAPCPDLELVQEVHIKKNVKTVIIESYALPLQVVVRSYETTGLDLSFLCTLQADQGV